MTLIIIIGDVGSGKTLMASLLAKYFGENRIILSNYWLDLPNYKPLQPEDLINLNNNEEYLIIIDECYCWLDSLTTSKGSERYLSYILFQSRKRNIDIILTSQLLRRININFKEMENLRIECRNDKLNKKFVYTFKFVDDRNMPCSVTFELDYETAKEDWNIFKTKQMVVTDEMKKLALEFILNNPNKLREFVNKVSEEIKPNLQKLTKIEIENQLYQRGYPKKILNMVYAKLKAESQAINTS